MKYVHVFALHRCVLFTLSAHCLFMVYTSDIIWGYFPEAEVIIYRSTIDAIADPCDCLKEAEIWKQIH